MKKALVLLCALAVVATASANLQLFLKDAGVSNYIFDRSERNYMPYWQPATGNEIPSATVIQAAPLDQTYYLWGRFTGEDDVGNGNTIIGIGMNITTTGNLAIPTTDSVIYRHVKANGVSTTKWHRWDGVNPLGINDPAAGVTWNGILNEPNPSATLPRDMVTDTGDDFGNQAFVIGAFRVTSGAAAPVGSININLTNILGIAMKDGNQSYYPQVDLVLADKALTTIQDRWYQAPPLPGSPVVHGAGAYLTYLPEPASLCLLGLAGLLLRRR
jgi:hypothetical protein